MTIKTIVSKACLRAMLPLAAFVGLILPASAEDDVFLWQVESASNTVYLLGSIHLLRETDYPLSQPIQAALEDAEAVVFEIDIAESKSPQTAETFVQAALPDNPDEVLYNVLDDETYRLAEETIAEIGLPFTGFNNFEPWVLYLSLVDMQALQLGFKPEYGVDAYLFEQANLADKDILTLETVEEQIGFFDDLSTPIQADLVRQTLLELDTFETSMETMVAAWKSGDISAFESVVLDGIDDFPEVYDALLVQRNQNWITNIEAFIDRSDDYLVVVGAAHLIGEDSVIQLLKDKGYTVEQARNSSEGRAL